MAQLRDLEMKALDKARAAQRSIQELSKDVVDLEAPVIAEEDLQEMEITDDSEHLQQVQKKLKMSLEDLCRQMPPPEAATTPKRRGAKDAKPDPWSDAGCGGLDPGASSQAAPGPVAPPGPS